MVRAGVVVLLGLARHAATVRHEMRFGMEPASAVMLNSDSGMSWTSLLQAELEANGTLRSPSYYLDIIRMTQVGLKIFCQLSKDDCETLSGFPGSKVFSTLSWDRVVDDLVKVPELQESGKIWRGNELGYLILNEGLWARDYKTIGLGASVEQHKFFRPIGDALLGSAAEGRIWSEDIIRTHLEDHLGRKATIHTEKDITFWTTRLMHKLHLNMDLSAADTLKFLDFQTSSIIRLILPTASFFGDLQDTRDYYLAKYIAAIKEDTREIFPTNVTDSERHFMASSLMDSMLFAGGLSVGVLTQVGLGVLHSDPSPWNVPDRQLTDNNVEQFTWEVIRRYPAVSGFPWYPLPNKEVRYVPNVATALRDPRVWASTGPVMDFILRPLETYRKLGRVAWAEPANGPDAWAVQNPGRTGNLNPMSRGCPGQALSFTILKTFFKFWAKRQKEFTVADAPKGGVSWGDEVPFVSAMQLAKVVKSGPVEFVRKGLMWSKSVDTRWAVLTAGSKEEQPAVLFIFTSQDYKKDNPRDAVEKLVLDETIDFEDREDYHSEKSAACLKAMVKSGNSVRLCFSGWTNEQNKAQRDSWQEAIKTAAMMGAS